MTAFLVIWVTALALVILIALAPATRIPALDDQEARMNTLLGIFFLAIACSIILWWTA